MAPKSSNNNTINNIDNVDADLQFEQDSWVENKAWVDKTRFPEFQNAYDDSQEHSSLNKSSRVQFSVKNNIQSPT